MLQQRRNKPDFFYSTTAEVVITQPFVSANVHNFTLSYSAINCLLDITLRYRYLQKSYARRDMVNDRLCV